MATTLVIIIGFMIWINAPRQFAVDAAPLESSVLAVDYDTSLVPPANDNFASGQVIGGMNGSTGVTNVEATGEVGEPNHAGVSLPLNSVWYRWTAPANLSMTFGTFGSGFNTTIAVYTGATVNSLTLVTENNDVPNGIVSAVTFIATIGTTYHIAVDGFGAATGTMTGGMLWRPNRAESLEQFNFDGDSRSDYSVYRLSNNTWYILNSGSGTVTALAWGSSGDNHVPGAYDGTRTNICSWRPSTGTFYKAAGVFAGDRYQQWGQSGDTPVQGDFDGDDIADFAIWRDSIGTFYVLRSTNGTLLAQKWGSSGIDVVAPGDYDGDGKTDFSVFRFLGSSAGTFYVLRSSNGSLLSQQWGVGPDIVVPGDYDGDGKSDFAVYRTSNNTMYVQRSSDGSLLAAQWGVSGDFLTPGDYDGDGKTDITVWRPSTGTYYVLRSSNGALSTQQWGISGDIPIAYSNVH